MSIRMAHTLFSSLPFRFLAGVAVLSVGLALGSDQSPVKAKGSPYPLATCPVSGKPLGDTPAILVMEDKENPFNDGREIRFCCPDCIETFKKEPGKFLPTIDAAIIAQQKSRYPLKTCVVMTEDTIPAAGEPDADKVREFVVLNDMVRICCPGCTKKIKKDPAKYLAMVSEAAKTAQRATYPMGVCPISGEALDADAAEITIDERLVKLCCMGCADKARAQPLAVLAKLDAAAAAAKTAPATPAPSVPAVEPAPSKP